MKRHKTADSPAQRGLKRGDCKEIKEACSKARSDYSAFRRDPSKRKPPMLYDDDGNMLGRAEVDSNKVTQKSEHEQMIKELRAKAATQRPQEGSKG